jgi:FAD/FMN-containing dehydrogenase
MIRVAKPVAVRIARRGPGQSAAFGLPTSMHQRRSLADTADALRVWGDRGLEGAVRGGHNVAGRSTTDGGLVVDLSLMRGVHVDPRARTARAQGGATWNGFNHETQRERGEFGRRAPLV